MIKIIWRNRRPYWWGGVVNLFWHVTAFNQSDYSIDQSNCRTALTFENKFTTPPHQYGRLYYCGIHVNWTCRSRHWYQNVWRWNAIFAGVAQGASAQIDTMMKWLEKTGSPQSRIDSCNFSNDRIVEKLDYEEFTIRRKKKWQGVTKTSHLTQKCATALRIRLDVTFCTAQILILRETGV